MRKWRNWQTRTFEGRVVYTVRVQVPFSAPKKANTQLGVRLFSRPNGRRTRSFSPWRKANGGRFASFIKSGDLVAEQNSGVACCGSNKHSFNSKLVRVCGPVFPLFENKLINSSSLLQKLLLKAPAITQETLISPISKPLTLKPLYATINQERRC